MGRVRRHAPHLLWLAATLAAVPAAPAALESWQRSGAGDSLPMVPTRHVAFDTSEGTWMSLDVSPDSGAIVFELLGHLYTMPATGGQATSLADGLAFDSQPRFSTDGTMICFVSDRSGSENLWVAHADGSEPRPLSTQDDNTEFVSPAWSTDGRSVFVSRYLSGHGAMEIWRYDLDGSKPVQISGAGNTGVPKDRRQSALGAVASRDGRFLYFAVKTGPIEDYDNVTFPRWSIVRRTLATGQEDTIVTAQGSAMRPALSPDGSLLAYATRFRGHTGLRLRDLGGGADRWLAYPVQDDAQETLVSRDTMPGYAFTPDGAAIVMNYGGRLRRIAIDDGSVGIVPFAAHVFRGIGPSLRLSLHEETGPVRARQIRAPALSPDGRSLAFSAFAHLYLSDLATGHATQFTDTAMPEFEPSWSPDGTRLVFVTWTAAEGGAIWTAPRDGAAPPTRLTATGAYYTGPVFTPDGQSVVALRSSNYERMHKRLEYGSLRQADAVIVPAGGGTASIIASGEMGGVPQFLDDAPERVVLLMSDGLDSMRRDGTDRRHLLGVIGRGFYFQDFKVPADDLRISPDQGWALAQLNQQLSLVRMPPDARSAPPVDLSEPAGPDHTRLTTVGADSFGWADGGRSITWSIGSTFYRRPLSQVVEGMTPTSGRPAAGRDGLEVFPIDIKMPRDVPRGSILLRGGTALTMHGDEAITDADVLITDDRIAAIGPRGTLTLPEDVEIRDVTGRFVMPGFVDTHLHYAEVRRGVLDLRNWGFLACLAYGVTTGFDPSTLSVDALDYEDLADAGMILAPRIYSTGPAVFSFNDFRSQDEVRDVLSRYAVDYRLHNLKEYRTGNRRVREWVAEESKALGLMPTTEGALDMKLDLTQVIDGYAGNEHSLAAVPLYDDVVQLFARTRVSYTNTLMIPHGGPQGQGYFFTNLSPATDPKVNRFMPAFAIDERAERQQWVRPEDYRFPEVAASTAKISRAGGLVGVGAHGEFEGLGFHWEMQMLASGGLSPAEVLHAATIGSAETIGRAAELGSLEPGKFADLIVLDRDPRADIRNTLSLSLVMKNGRLYDADTLDERWPDQRKLPPLWFWNEAPPAGQGRDWLPHLPGLPEAGANAP